MMSTPSELFMNARIGLEYEALFYIENTKLWEDLIMSTVDFTKIKLEEDSQVKYVLDHLQTRDNGLGSSTCQNIDIRSARGPLIQRNLLCKLFNEVIIQNRSIDNTYWFRAADGYKKAVCEGPGVHMSTGMQVVPPATNDTSIDKKFTWVITHDRSVASNKFDKHKENVLQHMEMVSPPLTIANSWTNIQFMLDSVFKRSGAWTSFHNVTTSNHVHFTLCTGSSTTPIWLEKPDVLYDMCLAWWHMEPVFMMLCEPTRRSNYFCGSMHKSICERYEGEEFGDIKDSNDFLKKIFKGTESYRMQEVLKQLTPRHKQFNRQLNEAWFADGSFFNANEVVEGSIAYTLMQIIYFFQGHPGEKESRYASLNLLNTITKVTTVESRLYEGSEDPVEVMSWINLVVMFFSHYQIILEGMDDEMHELCWDINDFMYLIDWDEVDGILLRDDREGDRKDIDSFGKIAFAYNYMMRKMGVKQDSAFRKYWTGILEKNIAQVYPNVSKKYSWFVDEATEETYTLEGGIQKLLDTPFAPLSRGGGKKKGAKIFVFLYGLDDIKIIARQLGIKRIKNQLAPIPATLQDHTLKDVGGRVVITKHKGNVVHGTIITLMQEQLSSAFGDTKFTKRQVVVEGGKQVLLCRLAARGKGSSQELTKEQSRKVSTLLKQTKQYV